VQTQQSAPQWVGAGEGAQVQFAGRVDFIIYRGDNDFGVFVLTDPATHHEITIAGTVGTLVEGAYIEGQGHILRHSKHGRQIQADWMDTRVPDDPNELRLFLCAGALPGIGPVLADALINRFGGDLPRILDNDPRQLLKINGISEAKLAAIREAWVRMRTLRHIIALLARAGIGATFALRAWHRWGPEAISILTEDPYRLTDIRGLAFLRVDEAALNLQISPDDPRRRRAALVWALREETGRGHVVTPIDALLETTAGLTRQPAPDLLAAMDTLIGGGALVRRPEALIGLPVVVTSEETIAGEVGQRTSIEAEPAQGAAAESLDRDARAALDRIGVRFEPSQHAALVHALTHRFSIITGGPGTGKTTILRALIEATAGRRVELCAPTGRAAQRMQQLTEHEARTIHRMLWSPQTGGFREEPIKCDFLIVDESSMIDVVLMADLLRRVPAQAHVVFVGDADQLPSVGPGACLRDLIAAGVPTARLTRVFRQDKDSGIALGAQAILAGRMPRFEQGFDFIEQRYPRDNREIVEAALERMRRHGEDAVQVLAPMRKGSAGTMELNRALRERLRSNAEKRNSLWGFCVGDRVIQVANNYTLEVMNGEIGKVVGVSPEPKSDASLLVQYDDHRRVSYHSETKAELRLAYAITIHKSQGGQFPCVVLAMNDQHYIMLDRTLLYTAATRAEHDLVLVGARRAVQMAVRQTRTRERRTRLQALIRD
jgi:exodeoxyribonuclease V alpha subunit